MTASHGPVAPPSPLRRAPGRVLIVAARYTSSPVGPYLELVISEPVRFGVQFAAAAPAARTL
ncbi:MAG: hypothetical protein M3144_08185 [Actinomycetota bacterium]|nr:hypothetical protein [Actinomycetota bacterium]